MKRHTRLCLVATLALAIPFGAPPGAAQTPAPIETGFINGQVTIGRNTMVYVVYVPWDYTPEKQWPVILSLHGGSLEGKDGIKPITAGLGVQVWLHPERFPCLVLFPQMMGSGGWDERHDPLVIRALDQVIQKYNGDRSRVSVTGFSAGGDGTWGFALTFPTRFAAAMPIAGGLCGSAGYALVSQLRRMPVWVFHGETDPLGPATCAREVVAALRKAGNTNVQYTEYPGVGHDSWDLAYGDPKVIEWLLAQKR